MTTDGSTDHPTNCDDARSRNLLEDDDSLIACQEPSNKKLDKDLNCTKIKMGTKKKKVGTYNPNNLQLHNFRFIIT